MGCVGFAGVVDVPGVAGVGAGAGAGTTVGTSSSFFCILALRAKMITRITNPPQRIPIIQRITVSAVPHPPLLLVVVSVVVEVAGVSLLTHVVPSIS